MNPIKFPEVNTVWAENQPEYIPLPAFVNKKIPQCETVFCWELSDDEIQEIIKTKKIWHSVWTFHKDLMPQLLSVEKPDMYVEIV